MKTIANKETRRKLLEELQNAVCIQLAIWSLYFAIEDLLSDGRDAALLIFQAGSSFELSDVDVEKILFGEEAPASTRFDKQTWQKLCRATQRAVWLHSSLTALAEDIAEITGFDLEKVTKFILSICTDADVALNVTETDIQEFPGDRLYRKLPLPEDKD